MKSFIILLIAALVTSNSSQITLTKPKDASKPHAKPKEIIPTGNPIPICNGENDGKCVTADDVTTPNKNAHGYNSDFEWSHN